MDGSQYLRKIFRRNPPGFMLFGNGPNLLYFQLCCQDYYKKLLNNSRKMSSQVILLEPPERFAGQQASLFQFPALAAALQSPPFPG